MGDIYRFVHPNQVIKLAEFNLKGYSSGQKKGQTKITKRGRSELRALLYQAALVAVVGNPQLRKLYHYLRTREKNPLKTKQAMVAVSNKLIRIIFTLIKKNAYYDASLALGEIRELQIQEAA